MLFRVSAACLLATLLLTSFAQRVVLVPLAVGILGRRAETTVGANAAALERGGYRASEQKTDTALAGLRVWVGMFPRNVPLHPTREKTCSFEVGDRTETVYTVSDPWGSQHRPFLR